MPNSDADEHGGSSGCALDFLPPELVREGEWNDLVRSLHGNFMHSYAWSQYAGHAYGAVRYFTLSRSGSSPVSAGWCVVSGKSLGILGSARDLQLEILPCFDPNAIRPGDVFREVHRAARKAGYIELTFGNSLRDFLDCGVPCEFIEKTGFLIDLQPPLDAMLRDMHERHRSRIRKAATLLSVRPVTGREAAGLTGVLTGMFEYSFSRHLSAGKERSRSEISSIPELVSELLVPEHAIVFLALSGNEPVSCYVAALFNRQANLLFSASNAKGYELNASFLIIRSMIEYFRDRGALMFDLGEVPRASEQPGDVNHGLYKYKAGFTRQTRPLVSGKVLLRPGLHALRTAVRRGKSCLARLGGGFRSQGRA